jgi:hypothetical protein
MTPQFPKWARAVLPSRSHRLKRIFYDTGHGFNCDHRGQYDADAVAVARGRTMAFFGNAFGLIMAEGEVPNITDHLCHRSLAKAVITCQV